MNNDDTPFSPASPATKINAPSSIYELLETDGVAYIHGTSGAALGGIAEFRALLSMEQINAIPRFQNGAMTWGEREQTVQNLAMPVSERTSISRGVSLTRVIPGDAARLHNSLYYYTSHDAPKELNYKVVFGIDDKINRLPDYGGHALSDGGIDISHVIGVYVPGAQVADAKQRLATAPDLAGRIKAWPQKPRPAVQALTDLPVDATLRDAELAL